MMSTNGKADPVTVEVIRGWLESVTEEMQATLVKTAYSPLICEARDATSALFDREGRTVAQASAMPIHLGVLAELGHRFAAKYPPGVAQPGDLYITNDPYAGGTHMPDIAVCAPVHAVGELVGYVATMAHHCDIGGLLPASVSVKARDIQAEGLRLPMIRLARGGEMNRGVFDVIIACSRSARSFRGDLNAQIAACRTGAVRYAALFEKWPVSEAYEAFTALMDYSETLTRAEISKVPNGEYEFADFLDDDALDPESDPVRIAVKLTVKDDKMIFDFAGTDPQVKAAINNVMASTAAVVYYAVRTLTGDRVPNNDGCYRPIEIRAPAGSIVNCTYPAPVASRGVSLLRIDDVVNGAMGQALPKRMTAAHSGQYTMVSVAGHNERTNKPVIGHFSGPVMGGHGARAGKDGIDVSSHGCVNGSHVSIEVGEARLPMRFNRLELWTDSGGAGRSRGGLGFFAEAQWLLGQTDITLRRERTRFGPWGLAGGLQAPPCEGEIVSSNGQTDKLPAKVTRTLRAGDKLRYWTTGSGGHGNPRARSEELVLADVLDGRVSISEAESVYGVVVLGGDIDREKTNALRGL